MRYLAISHLYLIISPISRYIPHIPLYPTVSRISHAQYPADRPTRTHHASRPEPDATQSQCHPSRASRAHAFILHEQHPFTSLCPSLIHPLDHPLVQAAGASPARGPGQRCGPAAARQARHVAPPLPRCPPRAVRPLRIARTKEQGEDDSSPKRRPQLVSIDSTPLLVFFCGVSQNAAGTSKPGIQLLFNGFANNDDLVALVRRSSLQTDGFMIKDGLASLGHVSCVVSHPLCHPLCHP